MKMILKMILKRDSLSAKDVKKIINSDKCDAVSASKNTWNQMYRKRKSTPQRRQAAKLKFFWNLKIIDVELTSASAIKYYSQQKLSDDNCY